MKNTRCHWLCAIAIAWLVPWNATGQESSKVSPYDAVWDQSVQQEFSGIVLVAEQGKIVFHRAHGFADAERQIALTAQTPMGIASISKSFTAVLIMQLVEGGQLRLDQTLAELLPQYPVPTGETITLRNLMMHTSGLPKEPDEIYIAPASVDAMLKQVLSESASYTEPGSFHYNNVDYLLLGEIIANLTGQPWQDRLQSTVLTPLGMAQTGFRTMDMNSPTIARGYMRDENGDFQPETAFAIGNYGAAGSMYSNTEDLLRYDQALHQNLLLTADSRAELFKGYPELGYVAMGHWAYNYPFLPSQPYLVERRGGIRGFHAVWVRFEEEQKTLIVLSNADTFNPDSFGEPGNVKEAFIRAMGQRDEAG
ncbi:MAG: serine hydrolase domain-containing protein [Lysobacterales bacterium]